MKYLFLLFLILPTMSFAKNPCVLEEKDWDRYLKMKLETFDQSVHGWRTYAANGCEISAGHLIYIYNTHNSQKLNGEQKRNLRWHAGQQFAMGNISRLGVVNFQYSYKEVEQPGEKWNAYVTASIAFLEKDFKKLKAARQEMLPFAEQNIGNMIIVNNMYKCPGLSYKQVTEPKPLRTCETTEK